MRLSSGPGAGSLHCLARPVVHTGDLLHEILDTASAAAPQPTIAESAEIDLVSRDPSSGAAVTPGDYLSLRVAYSTESLRAANLQASLEIILTIHGSDLSLTTEPVSLSAATGEPTLWRQLEEPLNQVAAWSAVRSTAPVTPSFARKGQLCRLSQPGQLIVALG